MNTYSWQCQHYHQSISNWTVYQTTFVICESYTNLTNNLTLFPIDQSLYSYAYEHTFLPVSVSSPGSKSPVFNTDEDTSYVEPDATIVAEVMEEIKTNSVSDGTYEVPEKELQSDSGRSRFNN